VRQEIRGAILPNFKRGDVEVVGGLVEDEHVGRLQHEAGDEDAGALAAAEALDGLVELLAGEEEARGITGDVDDAILVDDGIGVGREGTAEGDGVVELAHLREVDDAEAGSTAISPALRGSSPVNGAEERVLPEPLAPARPT